MQPLSPARLTRRQIEDFNNWGSATWLASDGATLRCGQRLDMRRNVRARS
jgi:hypothetical protein